MGKLIALINGPNLNLLGMREPEVYGAVTLENIVGQLRKLASSSGFEIWDFQSNIEGEIVNAIQQAAAKSCVGIIINPAAYSHTSVAIRDGLLAVKLPTIEVHLSNIYKREEFRHHSHVSGVANGVIIGLGAHGYLLALEALIQILKK